MRLYGVLLGLSLLTLAACRQQPAPFSGDTSKAVDQLKEEADNWVVLVGVAQEPALNVGIMDANRILAFDDTRIAETEVFFSPYAAERKIVFTTEYDCSQPRSRMTMFTTMGKTTSVSAEWTSYPPGHNYETTRQFVCQGAKAWTATGGLPTRMKGSADEIAQLTLQRFANTPRLEAGSDPFRHGN